MGSKTRCNTRYNRLRHRAMKLRTGGAYIAKNDNTHFGGKFHPGDCPKYSKRYFLGNISDKVDKESWEIIQFFTL